MAGLRETLGELLYQSLLVVPGGFCWESEQIQEMQNSALGLQGNSDTAGTPLLSVWSSPPACRDSGRCAMHFLPRSLISWLPHTVLACSKEIHA